MALTASQLARRRERFIDKQNTIWIIKVKAMQKRLTQVILSQFMVTLDTEGGNLLTNTSNYTAVNALDALYRDFMRDEAPKLIDHFIDRTTALTEMHADYFRVSTDIGKTSFRREIDKAVRAVYKSVGYNTSTKKLINNGPLNQIFTSKRPLDTLKIVILNAIGIGE